MADEYVVTGMVWAEASGETLMDAVKKYRAEFKNASPHEWTRGEDGEGGSIIGWCENCGLNIDDGEKYETDGEYSWHVACPAEPSEPR